MAIVLPTAHVIDDPTVNDPANGYDEDAGTYAYLAEPNPTEEASLRLSGLALAGAFDELRLEVEMATGTPDDRDLAGIWVRKTPGDPWSPVFVGAANASWGIDGMVRTFNLIPFLTDTPGPDVEFHVRFRNQDDSPPPG